jgi:hypothetical protein
MEVINMQQDEERESIDILGLGQFERGVVSTMMLKVYMEMQLLQLRNLFTK